MAIMKSRVTRHFLPDYRAVSPADCISPLPNSSLRPASSTCMLRKGLYDPGGASSDSDFTAGAFGQSLQHLAVYRSRSHVMINKHHMSLCHSASIYFLASLLLSIPQTVSDTPMGAILSP
ncbi:hypothetical protein N7G274_001577 [Stereocaulon virgatum]|uniref:Uncharacterized protein n=1 Tax=Stereocaulon virgatum TaxID=373712 RepID=A0ABR4AK40_9LECA